MTQLELRKAKAYGNHAAFFNGQIFSCCLSVSVVPATKPHSLETSHFIGFFCRCTNSMCAIRLEVYKVIKSC